MSKLYGNLGVKATLTNGDNKEKEGEYLDTCI